MPWVKVDDRARCHPKFFRAGCLAFGWWNAGLGYCNELLTNGFIATRDLELVFPGMLPADREQAVESLVFEGLIHVVSAGQHPACLGPLCRRVTAREDGYLMHDYLVYQPSKKHVEVVRHGRVQAARKGRDKSAEVRGQNALSRREQNALVPSRPVPARPGPSRPGPKKPAAAGDDEWLTSLASNPAYEGIDVRIELAKCQAWCHERRIGEVSRRRFLNWLNRAERPIRTANGIPPGTFSAKTMSGIAAAQRFIARGEQR